jgi:hypothetical protein
MFVRGLESGARVVLTRLDVATEGMAVQTGAAGSGEDSQEERP